MNVYDDVKSIKGVGSVTANNLNKCRIFNILDLLLYFPRDYEIISSCNNLSSINKKEGKVIIDCIVKSIGRDIVTRNKKILSTVVFENKGEVFHGKWFNQPYMKNKFKINKTYRIMGKVEKFSGNLCIINPKLIDDKTEDKTKDRIIPIYPLKPGITNNTFIKLVSKVIYKVYVEENLPARIIEKYKFLHLDKAIKLIHRPNSIGELEEARRRLKFQELFSYSLKILMIKNYYGKDRPGIAFKIAPELKELKRKIPYKLTASQSKAIREILLDEKIKSPMNRLLQGDVGCGKTIVAIIAIFNVVKNGYQAVLMAPTEILAKQHHEECKKFLQDTGINIELLCSSVTEKNKKIIKEDLKAGKIDIIIGTHALIEDSVEFKNIGIVVTDEQHRFGVVQRSKLVNKGKHVDTLVMTATPIPRTLSLCMYGDLDISTIDELPPGRKKVHTYYVDKNYRDRVYRFAVNQIKSGRQVYIVCPLVEENYSLNLSSIKEMYGELKEKYFKDLNIGVLYGKIPSKSKEEIMNKFKNGDIKAIISTTVIEVGINVPNATVMIIENAERFGLAQLHQLRGRVGRGEFKSYCVLIADIKSNMVKRKMEIMKNSNDGFFIAEEDLKIRGSGEIFGFRQHGEDGLIFSNLSQDIHVFTTASLEAKKFLESEEAEDIRIRREILDKLYKNSKIISFN